MSQPYYQDDRVTLYHGDCLEIDAWVKADVLVTDPPYGIGHRDGRAPESVRRRTERSYRAIVNDSDTAIRDTVLDMWGPDRPGLVFGHWRRLRPINTRQRLLWWKTSGVGPVSGRTHPWVTVDEEIYVIGRSMSQFASDKADLNVYRTLENRAQQATVIGHPTTKPVALMDQLIRKCPPGVIADPFAGSGSTLVAARNLGRRAIGVEIEEHYCELIARRLDQMCFDFEVYG